VTWSKFRAVDLTVTWHFCLEQRNHTRFCKWQNFGNYVEHIRHLGTKFSRPRFVHPHCKKLLKSNNFGKKRTAFQFPVLCVFYYIVQKHKNWRAEQNMMWFQIPSYAGWVLKCTPIFVNSLHQEHKNKS
jgi:hypothetical protein